MYGEETEGEKKASRRYTNTWVEEYHTVRSILYPKEYPGNPNANLRSPASTNLISEVQVKTKKAEKEYDDLRRRNRKERDKAFWINLLTFGYAKRKPNLI